MSFYETPILFLVFNRPDTTEQVLKKIRQVQPKHLFIAADGPRAGREGEAEKCRQVRTLIDDGIDWDCSVHKLYRDANLGCGFAVSKAINWFFTHNGAGVILEDDCVPHEDFFLFCTDMLRRFANDTTVISINGSNLGYELTNGNSYCYSRFMNMWGWATWKDRALSIDYSMRAWKETKHPIWWLYKHVRQRPFDFDLNWFRLWKFQFNTVAVQENFTWDWQWIWHQVSHRQLSVVPAVNLISNIGFHLDATHTQDAHNIAAEIPAGPLPQPFRHPATMKPDLMYEETYVKAVWCYHYRLPMRFYIRQFIAWLIKKNRQD